MIGGHDEGTAVARADRAENVRTLRALDGVVREGLIVLSPDGTADYVNARARRLVSEDRRLVERFAREVRDRLDGVGGPGPRLVRMRAPSDASAVVVEQWTIDEADGARVLVVRDAESADDLEEQLFLANRVRGMGDLYLSMAHDLKTPVNAMALTLDMLREAIEEARAGDVAAQMEMVDTVQDELGKLHRALQAFLEQTSLPSAARRPFDARRIVREVMRTAQPLAESHGVRLELDVTGAPCAVRGHAERLEQAVRNVVVNGIEATPEGGVVILRVREDGDDVVLTVLDEGPGVDEETTEHLFRMSTTDKPEGTGIGLFVARAAVVAHGGSIRLRNRARRGAQAEIRIPCPGVVA